MTATPPMERIRARLAATSEDERTLRVMLVLAHEALRRSMPVRGEEAVAGSSAPPAARSTVSRDDYAQLVDRVRAIVAESVPAGARLLVVSRGDDELLVPGFGATHFPQARDGRYAGYYPADSDDATAQLEVLRGAGAEFLVFPATSHWWLSFYDGLARHLLTTARVTRHDENCLIFDLRAAHHHGDLTQ